ncbi:MAG: HAD-IA family hydrolase [Nanoarchaeota archaeon]
MIKAILLDVDNTLVDFEGMKEKAIEASVRALLDTGLKMPFTEAYEKLTQAYWEEGIESNTWLSAFLSKYDKIDEIKIAAATNAYRKIKQAYLEPYPTVLPTLIKLIKKGIKLGIISDAPKLKVLKRVDNLKLLSFFDAIVTEANKPSKEGFEKALSLLIVAPQETIMIGDWPEKDLAGAKALGIKTCYARYGSKLRAVQNPDSDYTINSFSEIIDILEKENNQNETARV